MSLAHKDDYFETPQWLFQYLQEKTKLYFGLDVSADSYNAKCNEYIDEDLDALKQEWIVHENRALNTKCKKMELHSGTGTHGDASIFCNPPRSKNGKFVEKAYEQWEKNNIDIVILMCWNDLGNKYAQKLMPCILDGSIEIGNLGKIKFNKNGKESEFVSRLTYLWVWFKRKH
mgnify:CR=1 FL=1